MARGFGFASRGFCLVSSTSQPECTLWLTLKLYEWRAHIHVWLICFISGKQNQSKQHHPLHHMFAVFRSRNLRIISQGLLVISWSDNLFRTTPCQVEDPISCPTNVVSSSRCLILSSWLLYISVSLWPVLVDPHSLLVEERCSRNSRDLTC